MNHRNRTAHFERFPKLQNLGKILNTNLRADAEEFRRAILEFFKNIKQYKDELSSLMTPNFHVFYSQSNS